MSMRRWRGASSLSGHRLNFYHVKFAFMNNIMIRILLLIAISLLGNQSSAEIIDGFDCGYAGTRYLADVNGDGAYEYCRTVGDDPDTYVTCTRGLPGGHFKRGDEIKLSLKNSKGNAVCPVRDATLTRSVRSSRAFPLPVRAAPIPDLPPPPPADIGALPPPPPPSPPPKRARPVQPPPKKGCGMWMACCPDGTPVVGTECTPCQMNPANCSAKNVSPAAPVTSQKPTITTNPAGSSILFNVSNPSDRDFSCTLTWSVSWNDYGKPGGNTLNRTLVVQRKYNGLLMRDDTSYSNLRLMSFNYTCS